MLLELTKPLYNIQDETLHTGDSSKYDLYLRLGAESFSYAIFDGARNKFIALTVFDLGKKSSILENESSLVELLNAVQIPEFSFRKVSLNVSTARSVLVPNSLYKAEKAAEYLHFSHAPELGEKILSDTVRSLDALNIYSIPFSLEKAFRSKFSILEIRHSASCLISALLATHKNKAEKTLVVHVQSNSFEVVSIEGGKLLFYNMFHYQSPEDFMYYLMFACDRLGLNPEKISLLIVGEIERKSSIYSLIHKYFRNPIFGERLDGFQYSYGLSELPSHFFYNLYSQPLCGS